MAGSPIHFVLLLADAGMLALICAVQWLIYPSFSYFEGNQLIAWHHRYTLRIGLIVVPLMSIQLIGGAYSCLQHLDLHSALYLVLVLALWGLTFALFVPLHRKISKGEASKYDLHKLVSQNRLRTMFWAILFCWNIVCWYIPL